MKRLSLVFTLLAITTAAAPTAAMASDSHPCSADSGINILGLKFIHC